jgi:hypothetical protein
MNLKCLQDFREKAVKQTSMIVPIIHAKTTELAQILSTISIAHVN